MKIAFVLLAVIVQGALAYKTCKHPEASYGKYINSPLAFECPPGKRGTNNEGIRAQCVGIVRDFCSAPKTSLWKKGTRVNLDKCNSIPKYTPIASFTGPGGTYDGNNGHAGIFISCSDGNIKIADQWCAKPAKFSERTMSKVCGSHPASNCAEYFYTVEW